MDVVLSVAAGGGGWVLDACRRAGSGWVFRVGMWGLDFAFFGLGGGDCLFLGVRGDLLGMQGVVLGGSGGLGLF